MPVNVLQVVLISLVSVVLVGLAFPWALDTINNAMDMVEVSFIESQFDTCSDRILETARTGTNNKCFFNINRGMLRGKEFGLSYSITSSADLCDPHALVEIDEKRHVWQSCRNDGEYTTFEMIWMFPSELTVEGTGVSGSKMQGQSTTGSIGFDENIVFRTLTVYINFDYNEGETGNIVDMARTEITNEDVTLKVKFQ